MKNGWIKLHRKLTEWEWYKDANTFRLFLHLLLVANHKPKRYKGILIDAGQIVTCPKKLSYELDLSIAKIKTGLKHLNLTNEITIKTNNKGTVIQIVKYKDYQVLTNEMPIKSLSNDNQITTNKNDNKEKNEIINSDFSESCLNDAQWLEVTSMQNRGKNIKEFISKFDKHLITLQEQKKSVKEYKHHFTFWLAKQPKQSNGKINLGI